MTPNKGVYRVGAFVYTAATGELERNGEVSRLRPQAAQAFQFLTSRAGQLVTREELQRCLWPSGHVDADLGLNVCVQQIRAALHDDSEAPRYIETLRGRGYRLIAAVAPVGPTVASSPWHSSRGTRSALLGVFLLVLVAIGLSTRERAPARLAVLPVSIVPNDSLALSFLTQGLTEEIITDLANTNPGRLAVIAQSSVAELSGRGLSQTAVTSRLRADYVLESTLRNNDTGYRLTLQLLDVESGTYAWSRGLTLGDELGSNVTRAVRDGVMGVIAPEANSPATTPIREMTPFAREALLKARYLRSRFNQDDSQRAVTLLRETLREDSAHVELLVEIAANFLVLGEIAAADQALQQARNFDPDAEGLRHIAARVALYGKSDPWTAIEELKRAVATFPGMAAIHHDYAQALAVVGRFREAVHHGRRALDLDPVSSTVLGDIGWVFYYAGDFEAARQTCGETLELRPQSTSAFKCVLLAAALEDDLPSVRTVIESFLTMLGADSSKRASTLAAIDVGEPEDLWRSIRHLTETNGQLSPIDDARLHALMGNDIEALSALSRTGAGSTQTTMVLWDPVLASARQLPRFSNFVTTTGLEQYVRQAR